MKLHIDTVEHRSIKMKPYRTPIHNRPIVDKTLYEMLEANIIRRSRSPWYFPIVVVKKKYNTNRICIDFRQLNKITKTMSYPLPLIDDILAQLCNTMHHWT